MAAQEIRLKLEFCLPDGSDVSPEAETQKVAAAALATLPADASLEVKKATVGEALLVWLRQHSKLVVASAPPRGRFCKKPVEVFAAQWFQNGDHPDDRCEPVASDSDTRALALAGVALLSEGKVVRRFRHPDISGETACRHCAGLMHDHGWIDTLEGGHIVCPGDWIITGVQGERYPVKDAIFQETYEPAGAPKSDADRDMVIGALVDAAQTIEDVGAFDRHTRVCGECARACPEGDRLYDQMATADTGPQANVARALARLTAGGERCAAADLTRGPSSEDQVHRLGDWVLANVPGEPSRNEGAVDCAIRLLDTWRRERAAGSA